MNPNEHALSLLLQKFFMSLELFMHNILKSKNFSLHMRELTFDKNSSRGKNRSQKLGLGQSLLKCFRGLEASSPAALRTGTGEQHSFSGIGQKAHENY